MITLDKILENFFFQTRVGVLLSVVFLFLFLLAYCAFCTDLMRGVKIKQQPNTLFSVYVFHLFIL